jgi:hypothetical protein
MEIEQLKRIVSDFAKQYNFLEWKDISNLVTKSKPMFTKKQLQLDGKTYMQIEEYPEKTSTNKMYVLFIGKIDFILESSSKKGDVYSVDVGNESFAINLSEISDEPTLIETILEKCKEYRFL